MKKTSQRKEYGHLLGVLRLLEMKPLTANAMRKIRRTMGDVPLEPQDITNVKNEALSRLRSLKTVAPNLVQAVEIKCTSCGTTTKVPKSWNSKLCRVCKEKDHQEKIANAFVQRGINAQTSVSAWSKEGLHGKALSGGLPGLGKRR